jgi:hypothetical protein
MVSTEQQDYYHHKCSQFPDWDVFNNDTKVLLAFKRRLSQIH